MAHYDYDAVVIGSGPAGEKGAVAAALLVVCGCRPGRTGGGGSRIA